MRANVIHDVRPPSVEMAPYTPRTHRSPRAALCIRVRTNVIGVLALAQNVSMTALYHDRTGIGCICALWY